MPKNNTLDYLEIPSRAPELTKAFFSQLLGWTFQDYGPDYTCFQDAGINGGFWRSGVISSVSAGAPLIVIYHSDLERTAHRVTELGGTITKEIFPFPGGRRFHFAEPGGTEFGIWSE